MTQQKKNIYEMSKQKQIIRELCLHLQSNSYVTFPLSLSSYEV